MSANPGKEYVAIDGPQSTKLAMQPTLNQIRNYRVDDQLYFQKL
jgi:hypothetical protein